MDGQQLLVAYPCALLYGVFALISVFWTDLSRMWISMGRIHKKDIGLLKLDQQTPAVQLLPITSSLGAAEVDESLFACTGQLNLVWSPSSADN